MPLPLTEDDVTAPPPKRYTLDDARLLLRDEAILHERGEYVRALRRARIFSLSVFLVSQLVAASVRFATYSGRSPDPVDDGTAAIVASVFAWAYLCVVYENAVGPHFFAVGAALQSIASVATFYPDAFSASTVLFFIAYVAYVGGGCVAWRARRR
jgi:hypothetical protein